MRQRLLLGSPSVRRLSSSGVITRASRPLNGMWSEWRHAMPNSHSASGAAPTNPAFAADGGSDWWAAP